MEHSQFDKLFSSTMTPELALYTDAAMNYLSELEFAKEKFEECSELAENLKKQVAILYQSTNKYKEHIKHLQLVIQDKNREISSLRSQIGNGDLKFVDLDLIGYRVKALEERIKVDTEKYHRSGKYSNIEQTINDVRNLFNVVLFQLNKANAENLTVESYLKTLMTLDVSFTI